MSETVRTLRAVLSADDQMSQPIRNVQVEVAGLDGAFKALTRTIAAQQLYEGVKNLLVRFSESEASIRKFEQALSNAGQESAKNSASFQALATQLQRTTTNTDEAVMSAGALLVSVGKLSGDGLERATRASADLAESLGIDLNHAALLVAKAAEGNTAALKRYGIQVDESLSGSMAFEEVLRQLESRFGGMAEAAGATTKGAMAQLGTAIDDIREKLGGALVGAGLVDQLKDITDALKKFNDGEVLSGIASLKLVAGIAPLNPGAWGAAQFGRASSGKDVAGLPVSSASGRLPAPGYAPPSGQEGVDATLARAAAMEQEDAEWRKLIADTIEYYKTFDELFDKWKAKFDEETGRTFVAWVNRTEGERAALDEAITQWEKDNDRKLESEQKTAEQIEAIRARLAEKSAMLNEDYAKKTEQGNLMIARSAAQFAEAAFGDSKAGAMAAAAINEAASIAEIWAHWAWNPAIAGALTALSVATFAAQIAKINSTEFKGHAFGGIIPGVDNGKDTYPALLRPGEAVLPPELVNAVMSGSGGGAITIEATGDLGMLMAAMNAKVKSGSATLIASRIGTGSRTVR